MARSTGQALSDCCEYVESNEPWMMRVGWEMLLYAKARTTGTYTECSDTLLRTQTELSHPGYSRTQSLHSHRQIRSVGANTLSSHVPNHADDPPLSHEHGSLLTIFHATPRATVAAQSAPGCLRRWSSPRERADLGPSAESPYPTRPDEQ